jgi:hypothetical protein
VVMKRLKKFLKRRTEPQKPPEVEVKRQHSLQDDYDEAMMAVTFAEAGAPEQAVVVMRQYGKRKILVVSQEDAFTEAVMEYATQLAERMGYDLIALNVGTATSDKGLSAYQQHMQEEFQGRAAKAVEVLEQKAAAKNIRLTHVVKFGEVANAVAAMNREYRRIEMLITDSRTQKEELPARLNLPVFSLKTNH